MRFHGSRWRTGEEWWQHGELSNLHDAFIYSCVFGQVKLHVHSNEPGHIFDMCKEEFSEDETMLQKEKVEDMFLERQQSHGKAKYDMRNAKVHIVVDACALPFNELDHCTLVPVWLTHDRTGEAVLLGDKNSNVWYTRL